MNKSHSVILKNLLTNKSNATFGEVMILPAGLRTEDAIDQDNFVRHRKDDGLSIGISLQNNEKSNRNAIEYIQKTTSSTLISNAENLVEQKMSDYTINSSVDTEIITKNF